MRPEDWQQGIEHEAASVEDWRWAQQARRVAWRRRRWGELRSVLTWRPLSRLLLLILLLPALVMGLLSSGPWPSLMAAPFAAFLDSVLSGRGSLLLLVIWTVRYVHLGYAPWALALIGAVTGPLFVLTLVVRVMVLRSDQPDEFWRLVAAVVVNGLFTFALLWGLGWAITRLRPALREPAP